MSSQLLNSLNIVHDKMWPREEECIFFSKDGSVYRKTFRGTPFFCGWLILTNKNKACGWYPTASPFVHEEKVGPNGTEKVITHGVDCYEDHHAGLFPSEDGLKVYDVKNLHYCLSPSDEGVYEMVHVYLKTNDNTHTLLGHMFPLGDDCDNEWTDPFCISQQEWLNWVVSAPLSDLPVYYPKSYTDYATYMDYEACEAANIESLERLVSEEEEEWEEEWGEVDYRVDPYDNLWYTKEGFIDYYGDTLFWDMLSPEKVSQRFMIETILFRNKDSLSTKNINHLLDKMIQTCM